MKTATAGPQRSSVRKPVMPMGIQNQSHDCEVEMRVASSQQRKKVREAALVKRRWRAGVRKSLYGRAVGVTGAAGAGAGGCGALEVSIVLRWRAVEVVVAVAMLSARFGA